MEHAKPNRAPQKAKKISVVEAAIVTAGFEYRSVRSYEDAPEPFSRPLVAYAVGFEAYAPRKLSEALLAPLTMRLANTASDEAVERERAKFLALETHRRIISMFCFDELRNIDLAFMFRTTPDLLHAAARCHHLKDGEGSCCVPVRANLLTGNNDYRRKAFEDCYLGCVYAYSGVTDDAGAAAAEAVGRCCHRASALRRKKYFTLAATILDEAIKLGNPA
jgi:hypothetical protein